MKLPWPLSKALFTLHPLSNKHQWRKNVQRRMQLMQVQLRMERLSNKLEGTAFFIPQLGISFSMKPIMVFFKWGLPAMITASSHRAERQTLHLFCISHNNSVTNLPHVLTQLCGLMT